MTRDETKRLLTEIANNYTKFQMNGTATIDSWYDRLKDVSIERALQIFAKWLESEKGDFPPSLSHFIRESRQKSTSVFRDTEPHKLTITADGLGLIDEKGREWGFPGEYGPYHLDKLGHICNAEGRVLT